MVCFYAVGSEIDIEPMNLLYWYSNQNRIKRSELSKFIYDQLLNDKQSNWLLVKNAITSANESHNEEFMVKITTLYIFREG